MIHAGLVLEGGGMRGMYTAGVLDFLIEKNMVFENCYGVSAGACHLCSYISKQHKRAFHAGLDFNNDRHYCGYGSLLTTGDYFNVKTAYDLIPNKYLPYDYKEAARYEGNAFAAVTNIVTGQPEYFPLREMHHDIIYVRASSSLPILSRNVEINGKLYLDGGISDPIPIRHSLAEGNKKNLVVITKPVGYVRKPSGMLGLIQMKYKRKYPEMCKRMETRHTDYNETMRFIEEQEKAGNLLVLRPQEPDDIGRIEKDRAKLEALYQKGYDDAATNYEKMMTFFAE